LPPLRAAIDYFAIIAIDISPYFIISMLSAFIDYWYFRHYWLFHAAILITPLFHYAWCHDMPLFSPCFRWYWYYYCPLLLILILLIMPLRWRHYYY
jgi:hypothetical protein